MLLKKFGLGRLSGFEPELTPSQGEVLPLHHSRHQSFTFLFMVVNEMVAIMAEIYEIFNAIVFSVFVNVMHGKHS